MRDTPTVKTLRDRAKTFHYQGSWECANWTYSQLFRVSVSEKNIPAACDALRGNALVYQALSHFEAAQELASLSYSVASLNGYRAEAARALNISGVVYQRQQKWEEARRLYIEANELALNVGDSHLAGWTAQNLGIVSNILGELMEAKMFYLEAIASSIQSMDRINAINSYNNLGMVCSDLKEWCEAKIYFERGIEMAESENHFPLLAKLSCNISEPLMNMKECRLAHSYLDAAVYLAKKTGETGTLSDIYRLRGVLFRLENSFSASRDSLAKALELSAEDTFALEHAEALRELAILHHEEGEIQEALRVVESSRIQFEALRAERDKIFTENLKMMWESKTAEPSTGGG